MKGNLKAQAFLSMVLFIGGIMVIAGVTMAVIAATFIDSGYGAQASDNAEATATAGIEDAMLQLTRNSGVFSGATTTYALGVGSYTANVTVGIPTGGLVTVVSTATVNSRTRKMQAILSVSPATAQVSLVSWGDVL